jgi:hypothetical protein
MGGVHNIYPGADYGFDPYFNEPINPDVKASEFSLAVDPRTANQLQEVSSKLSTGAKSVEVQMISPEIAESIPNQHLEEINRLKKLIGAGVTLHAPIIEPTGISRDGWSEASRKQAEEQMWDTIKRAQKIDPKGNLIVTLHSSAGLPELQPKIIEKVEGKPQEVIKEFWAVDENEGKFASMKIKENVFTKEKPSIPEALEQMNKESWSRQLYQINFHTHNARRQIYETAESLKGIELKEDKEKLGKKGMLELYKMARTKEGQEFIQDLKPEVKAFVERGIHELDYEQANLQEAYNELQGLFTQAYKAAEKDKEDAKKREELETLKKYREEVIKAKEEKVFDDPAKLVEFSNVLSKGTNLLNSLTTPQVLKPLQNFALDKASDTFSGVAFKAFKEFKENSPIISIENPPTGMAFSRADELNQLIDMTRKKFEERAVETGMSREEAKKAAEKLIGATWDVGHINMIRKFGYEKEAVVKETEKIAKKVKHVHLSDNFGFEHTELPMGMADVPAKAMLNAIKKENKDVKHVIETGNWYQHFKVSPFKETLASFGSPIYAAKMAPYWQKAIDVSGGYFAGYGLNPDIHHSLYGAGFSNLPVELGGQMAGRSRVSGAPID